MSWVKLERANDWGVDYWSKLGEALKNGTADQNRGINFHGAVLTVRWPDGRESTESIVMRRRNAQVSDHGHTYSVSFDEPIIVVYNRGVKTSISVDKVEFWSEELDLLPRNGNGRIK